ncbi:MAG: CbiX/SirB N-terminal domain-containing protein [Mariprofundaceae bacterium]
MNILLSHGSPDARHREAVTSLADQVATNLGETVEAAFLEDRIAKGTRVLPLFLTRGRHLQQDVPAMAEAGGARLLRGPADYPGDMARMALELALQAREKQRAVMFAVYRLIGAEALMSELYEVNKKFPLPAIAGLHGQCDVASVLGLWSESGLKDVLIQPVLLFPGKSLDALAEIGRSYDLNVKLAAPLVEHEGFAAWLADRFREAA